ncbi:hybrid sensor histidine kinase/response regulator [Kaarinaea lacus]
MTELTDSYPTTGPQSRILVVDDDPMLRNLIKLRLKRRGYVVYEADDGEQAVTAFHQCLPEIVLMDANMPGVDGFAATQAIKNLPEAKNTPIIMVSGLEDDESVDRAFEVGAVEYITKPICWPLLIHRLANICASMQAKQEIMQAKLNADRANQSKSEFLANMSHELRTPMHAILSFASMGEEKVFDAKPEKLQQYFSRISESGLRLLALLNDLLDLSKLEAGAIQCHFKPHNVVNIVDTVLQEMGVLIKQKGVTVIHESMDIDARIVCDSEKIMQVVRNLLSNAIKFTPAGKCIFLHYAATTVPATKSARQLPALALSVIDQGIGIPEDELSSVFDKFVQSSKTKTGAGGTGLGLAICREIIDRHEGIIGARNNDDGGATFEFKIPVDALSGRKAA